MATFKAVVDHRKADGTYCVKIRITHNRKSLYIPTALYVTDKHLTKSKEIKDHGYIIAANRIIDEMREIVMNIAGLQYMECERLRKIISDRMGEGKEFHLDFYEYAMGKIEGMKPATAMSHKTAFNNLRKFKPKLDINELTSKLMINFKKYLKDNGVSCNSANLYMIKIQHILNIAKDEFNDDDSVRIKVNPFRKGVIEAKKPSEHRVLTASQIRRIATIKGDRYENYARDIFILSFCLVGINIVDLYPLKKSDVKNNILTYCRTKTRDKRADNAMISIRIEKEAKAIIDNYKDNVSDCLFNFHYRHKTYESMSHCLRRIYKRFKNYDPSLPAELTYYYARHSWATIAYNDCGIDMQTIHEALNHASDANMKITDVYVKKDFTRIWDANRKVLDFVFKSKH
jgi:integrase